MSESIRSIGPYEIRGELGRGGMGVVWLAWDPRLEREVALKQLPPELARDDTVRQRFVTEARSAAKLHHPGILPLFDVGESEGLPFFVMQKVDGGDLADHLAVSGRMSLDAAAPLLRQMAAAIDHAHQAGVVHRDIKPENILLDKSGQALLTDFGIARAAESGNRGLTRTGMILGTPEYMSPEQAAGGAVDHRADLYSFGVIAYRMLTGTVPFGGDSVLGVAMQHVSAPPPDPRLLAPELSEGVARALQVMLAKEPGQRYQSASEFVERLTAGDEQRPAPAARAATVLAPLPGVTPSAPPAAGSPRNLGLAVVAAALVLGVSLVGAAYLHDQTSRTAQAAPAEPPEPEPPAPNIPPPPETRVVLNVVGQAQAEAERKLQSTGLTTGTKQEHSTQPYGTVVRQNPPADIEVPLGKQVTLVISKGPAPPPPPEPVDEPDYDPDHDAPPPRYDFSSPDGAVAAFHDAITNGDFDTAYNGMTRTRRNGYGGVGKFSRDYAATEYTTASDFSVSGSGNTRRVTCRIDYKDVNQSPATVWHAYEVVRDGGRWYVGKSQGVN